MSSGKIKPIRILAADDHALLRQGIASLVGLESDLELVAEAATGREAVEQFKAHRPDITLMTLQMSDAEARNSCVAQLHVPVNRTQLPDRHRLGKQH